LIDLANKNLVEEKYI
jgi:hypothetical protein